MRLSKYYSSDRPFGTKVFMAPTDIELVELKENWINEMEKGNCKIEIIEGQGPIFSTVGRSQNGDNCTLSFRYRKYYK